MMAGVMLLCLVETGYVDIYNGTEYTVLGLAVKAGSGNFREKFPVTALELWCAGTGRWLVMFLPAVASSGYLLALSEERRHGNRTFILMRSGITGYCVSKALSACVMSGLFCTAGYALYGLFTAAVFPHAGSCDSGRAGMILAELGGTSVPDVVWKRILGMFVFGMACALPGFALGCFFNDRYVLVCVPVLVSYLYGQAVAEGAQASRTEAAVTAWNAADAGLLRMGPYGRLWYATAGMTLVLWAAAAAVFILRLRSERKKGVQA